MLKNGDRVKHSHFGIGQVVDCEKNVWVYFLEFPEDPKRFSKSTASQMLKVIYGEEAKSLRLDNLRITFKNDAPNYKNLLESINTFKHTYKLGFDDPVYLDSERNYKIDAHNQAHKLLGESTYKELLDEGDSEEICKRVLKIIGQKSNFLHSIEMIKLNDAMKDNPEAQDLFAKTIYSYLYGAGSDEEKFDLLSNILGIYKVDTWPTFSVLGFLFFPETKIMLKPATVKNAAELSGFNISYETQLNIKTYSQTQKFYQWLRSELEKEGLQPKDLIDIQSFMWIIKKD